MHNTHPQSFLDTVLYYDLLDFPLNPEEAILYGGLDNYNALYKQVMKYSKYMSLYRNHLCLIGREKIVDERIAAFDIQKEKWKVFERMQKKLTWLPFIEMMFASGSFALMHCNEKSDLDVFIICSSGRIATARFFITIWTRVLGIKRVGLKVNDHLCLNHFVTKDSMPIGPQNLYTARLYSRFIPVMGRKSYYSTFVQKNMWIKEYVVHYPLQKFIPHSFVDTKPSIIENILSGKFGDFLEKILYRLQRSRFD
ncbi:MAG: hypothetical protein U9Q15_00580, partial [Patescibacteria group bacterium]|nr:hypothetical protein [Patescibacteria group bacterium]